MELMTGFSGRSAAASRHRASAAGRHRHFVGGPVWEVDHLLWMSQSITGVAFVSTVTARQGKSRFQSVRELDRICAWPTSKRPFP